MRDESKLEVLTTILDRVSIIMGIVDKSGKVIFANRRFKSMLGETAELERLRKIGKISPGKPFYININGVNHGFSVYEVEHYTVFVGRKLEDTGFFSAKALDYLDFVFTALRHELGNPVNTIKFSLSVMKENILDYSPRRIMELIDRLIEEIETLEKVLLMMKNLSGWGKINLEKIFLSSFVIQRIELFKMEALAKDIKVEIGEIPDICIMADPIPLEHVLKNILKNSMEALSRKEGERIIKISLKQTPDYAILEVADNGTGIPEDIRDKIFLPFFTTKVDGTGMGLPLSQRLMVSMDGFIEIESDEKGTRARIYIPLCRE